MASAPTLYRTLRVAGPGRPVGDLWARHGSACAHSVWARRGAPVDATAPVVVGHRRDAGGGSQRTHKQGAAAHYKGGYGFHPLLCFSDDGDALAALLRPGNAAANSIADHIELLDAAIGQLPAAVGAGHHVGDDAADAARPLRVRADSAGCSVHIAQACRDRNVAFSLVARANDAIDACGCRKPGRGWSGRMSVLAEESVASCRFHGFEVLVWLVRRVGRVRGSLGE